MPKFGKNSEKFWQFAFFGNFSYICVMEQNETPKFPAMTPEEAAEAREIAQGLSSGPYGKILRSALSGLVKSGKTLYISIDSGKIQIVVKKKLIPNDNRDASATVGDVI